MTRDLYDFHNYIGPAHAVRSLMIAASGLHSTMFQINNGAPIEWLMAAFKPLVATHKSRTATNVIYHNSGIATVKRPEHFTIVFIRPSESPLFEKGWLPYFLEERNPILAIYKTCPCGKYQHPEETCTCTEEQLAEYQFHLFEVASKFDIVCELTTYPPDKQFMPMQATDILLDELYHADEFRGDRLPAGLLTNVEAENLDTSQVIEPIKRYTQQDPRLANRRPNFARVARTIADLAGEQKIQNVHMAESLQWRPKLWTPW